MQSFAAKDEPVLSEAVSTDTSDVDSNDRDESESVESASGSESGTNEDTSRSEFSQAQPTVDWGAINDANDEDYEFDLAAGNYSSDVLALLGASETQISENRAKYASNAWSAPTQSGLAHSSAIVTPFLQIPTTEHAEKLSGEATQLESSNAENTGDCMDSVEGSCEDDSQSEQESDLQQQQILDWNGVLADANDEDYEFDLANGNYSSDILVLLGASEAQINANKAKYADTVWSAPTQSGPSHSNVAANPGSTTHLTEESISVEPLQEASTMRHADDILEQDDTTIGVTIDLQQILTEAMQSSISNQRTKTTSMRGQMPPPNITAKSMNLNDTCTNESNKVDNKPLRKRPQRTTGLLLNAVNGVTCDTWRFPIVDQHTQQELMECDFPQRSHLDCTRELKLALAELTHPSMRSSTAALR